MTPELLVLGALILAGVLLGGGPGQPDGGAGACPPRRATGRRTRVPGVGPGGRREDPDVALDLGVVLTLARAAIAAGTSVPGTLRALGRSGAGVELERAGASLLLGAPWDEAVEDVPARWLPLLEALAPAWTSGADPGPLLAQAADAVGAGRARATRIAAARLGVRLVLPLGLCFLPAFVLLGLVPVVVSFAGDLLSVSPLTS